MGKYRIDSEDSFFELLYKTLSVWIGIPILVVLYFFIGMLFGEEQFNTFYDYLENHDVIRGFF